MALVFFSIIHLQGDAQNGSENQMLFNSKFSANCEIKAQWGQLFKAKIE